MAAWGEKWMSATSGTFRPLSRNPARMAGRASASAAEGTVTRTISQPAATRRSIWATVAGTSVVAGVVMDCTRIGSSPPTPTSPMATTRVRRRVRAKGEGQ